MPRHLVKKIVIDKFQETTTVSSPDGRVDVLPRTTLRERMLDPVVLGPGLVEDAITHDFGHGRPPWYHPLKWPIPRYVRAYS